jgi:hypothetical protein
MVRQLPDRRGPAGLLLFPALFLCLAASLSAQRRGMDEYARTPGVRPDHTIFSPLDLPAPNRMRAGSGAPGADYWQQRVDYRIDVTLEPSTRSIAGRVHVSYHNHSPDPLDYIWVHLEQNVLRKDSIGSLTDGTSAMGGPTDHNEGVRVSEVSAAGRDLEHQIYDTMMRVSLPSALAPGKTFECDIAWGFDVPKRVFRRYGTMKCKKGTVWELAQWFPAVAVYDDVNGWNTLPYMGTGEFYTNFGDYELNITVPRDHIVVATGVLQNEAEVYTATQRERLAQARESAEPVMILSKDEVGAADSRPAGDGPLTWRFHSKDVRTVAFASSEAFILDAASVGETLVQSVYPEDSLPVWGKSTAMLCAAIKGYNERWCQYPYPVATNVAGIEGGMEYPMIIFCSGRNKRNERGLYDVTTHEIGHNWFPMMVNTDERRYAWMDEGFNTFINMYSTADWFKKNNKPSKPSSYAMMMRMPGVPVVTAADRLNGLQLGLLQYQKTGVGMQLLREYILGPERFDFAFRTYIQRWKFKSPQPADFFRTMEDAAGMDLAWFWRGWFLEDALLDQAIDSVRTSRRGARITFLNKERMVMPLTFEVEFEDGSKETLRLPVQVWFKSDKVVHLVKSDLEIVAVRLDPGRMLPDNKRTNNSWKAEE